MLFPCALGHPPASGPEHKTGGEERGLVYVPPASPFLAPEEILSNTSWECELRNLPCVLVLNFMLF